MAGTKTSGKLRSSWVESLDNNDDNMVQEMNPIATDRNKSQTTVLVV